MVVHYLILVYHLRSLFKTYIRALLTLAQNLAIFERFVEFNTLSQLLKEFSLITCSQQFFIFVVFFYQ